MSSVPPLNARPSTPIFLPNSLPHFLQKLLGAPQVDVLHFLKQPTIDPVLARQVHEGAKILGEAVAPEADAGVQKLTPDTRVESHWTGVFLGGTDADKQDCGSAYGVLHTVGKSQSATGESAGEQIVQAGLVERHLPHRIIATLGASSSAPITSQPASAKPSAVGRPTCPSPRTAMRALSELDVSLKAPVLFF